MEFYEAVEKRRTIRDFENEEIPQAVVERIIAAALKLQQTTICEIGIIL